MLNLKSRPTLKRGFADENQLVLPLKVTLVLDVEDAPNSPRHTAQWCLKHSGGFDLSRGQKALLFKLATQRTTTPTPDEIRVLDMIHAAMRAGHVIGN